MKHSGNLKKLIYFIFLVGSIVLVSFRGGNIAYILFYFALAIPLASFAYMLYVYFRVKLAQEVSRIVIKNQEIPYRLRVVNENFIPFIDVRLNFFTDAINIRDITADDGGVLYNKQKFEHLCLPPKHSVVVDMKMHCKHRGTYSVGVKSVTVTDLFGIFDITYPLISKIRLTAKPRILPLEVLGCTPAVFDSKNNLFSFSNLQDLPDNDLRKYYSGDRKKYIHWKNSAKTGELLVRKQTPQEICQAVIIVDLSPIQGDEEARLKAEDAILEATMAFVNDYFIKKIPVKVVYFETSLKQTQIFTQREFDAFYQKTAEMFFSAKHSIENVWQMYLSCTKNDSGFIIITANNTAQLQLAVQQNSSLSEAFIVDTGGLTL